MQNYKNQIVTEARAHGERKQCKEFGFLYSFLASRMMHTHVAHDVGAKEEITIFDMQFGPHTFAVETNGINFVQYY